jgi:predicted anti-sigma-YlaC factor YlaD
MERVDVSLCQTVLDQLADYLDRELTPEGMRVIQLHLERCGRCAAAFAGEAVLLRGIRSRLQQVSVPSRLLDRLSRALERA